MGVGPISFTDACDLVRKIRSRSALSRIEELCTRTLLRLPDARDAESAVKGFLKEAAQIAIPSPGEFVKAPQEWVEGARLELEGRRAGTGPVYYDLGLPDVTRAIAGERGHLVILAAETGKGKTALALNIAANLAVDQAVPTLYVNTEMGWDELAIRLYAILGEADLFALRTGQASDADMQKVDGVYRILQHANALYITDAMPWATIEDVSALIREYVMLASIEVVIVDYIQRFEDGFEGRETWENLLKATKRLKSLAQELNILAFVVAQLNDQQHLAGAKGMAREADTLAYLEEDEERIGTHRLRLVKARHGPSGGVIRLLMDRKSLKFLEVVEEELDKG